MKKILLAHDGSVSSDKALKKAIEIAGKFNSSITVISVVPELYLTELTNIDRDRILDTLNEEANKIMLKIKTRAKGIKAIKTVVTEGNPPEEILRMAKKIKADIIITGCHGRHGAGKFLLGSVSSKIIDHATCDVLIVK